MSIFEFLKDALQSVPEAATNPLALVAYLAAILAWAVISWRVVRNRQLVAALQKLPAEDRLRALEIEMGSVHVASGLTAEQWLKSRTQLYVFSALVIFAILMALLVGLLLTRAAHGNVDIEMGLHPKKPSGTISRDKQDSYTNLKISDPFYVHSDQALDEESLLTVTYKSERHGNEIEIRPFVPYVQRLAEGGPVSSISYRWTPFESEPPELFVKVTNNTDQTVLLTEAVCKVISSVIHNDQIIIFHRRANNRNHLQIENLGWGSVTNPILRFRIEPLRSEDDQQSEEEVHGEDPRWYTHTSEEIKLDSFDQNINVDLTKYLPLQTDSGSDIFWVTVVGTLSYGTYATRIHTIMFYADVALGIGHGGPRPPSWEYDLFLTAGKSNYEEILDISQELKKGDADNFLIRVHSDRSAVFDTQFSFRSTSGQELVGNHVKLFIFEPRQSLDSSAFKKSHTLNARQ